MEEICEEEPGILVRIILNMCFEQMFGVTKTFIVTSNATLLD